MENTQAILKNWGKRLIWLPAIALTLAPFYFLHLEKELKFFKRHATAYKRFVDSAFLIPRAELSHLPAEFSNVPYGEATGVVLNVKTVNIRGVTNPYNASITKREGEGYRLFFRYDQLDENIRDGLRAYVGSVDLDQQLNQSSKEFVCIDTHSDHAEDPRILQTKDQTFLIYNDLVAEPYPDIRVMCIAEVDEQGSHLKNIQMLNPKLQQIEKNWAPFEYVNAKDSSNIYFEYSLDPRKIVAVNPHEDGIVHFPFSYNRTIQQLLWPQIWGSMRGGTAAQKVGDQYLAFFHSSFYDKNNLQWYCMGAYTFEAKPPFRITGVSHYPILFEGIYGTPPMNTAAAWKRVIFPCGFVVTEQNGKEVILLSCGENDSSVKVITLDKQELLKNLNKVKLKTVL